MSVKDDISTALKEAMKARNQVKLDTLRSALSAFTYKRVEAGHDLSDEEMLDAIRKQVKQRNDSITEYVKAGRQELADKEQVERDILSEFLPATKTPDEVRAIVKTAVGSLAADARNQGAIMKIVMPQVKGVDGNLVRTIVTEELASA